MAEIGQKCDSCLYIPLGGNRYGNFRRYANLLTTMLLGGLWHGAGWTYVVWGGLHGLYLCINHGWSKLNIVKLPKFLAWIITFIAVIFSWVLFRALSFSDGWNILQAMVGLKGVVIPGELSGKLGFLTNFGIQLQSWSKFAYLPELNGSKTLAIFSLIILICAVKLLPNTQELMHKFKPNLWWATSVGILTGISLLSLNRVSEFLYFQF